MGQLIFFLCSLLFTVFANAQAYEGKIEYNKKKQAAFVIEFPYPPEAVENAIIQRMEHVGYKGKEEKGLFNKDKGFRVYKNIYVTDISDKRYDYILLVERKSRKEKDEAVLYLLVNRDGESVVGSFDAADMNRTKSFLNTLQPEVEEAHLELQIKEQEELVTKTEKKFRSLQSDKEEMENKIKKLEDDIEKNLKAQEDTQKDIENQKQLLESLKLKRRY